MSKKKEILQWAAKHLERDPSSSSGYKCPSCGEGLSMLESGLYLSFSCRAQYEGCMVEFDTLEELKEYYDISFIGYEWEHVAYSLRVKIRNCTDKVRKEKLEETYAFLDEVYGNYMKQILKDKNDMAEDEEY